MGKKVNYYLPSTSSTDIFKMATIIFLEYQLQHYILYYFYMHYWLGCVQCFERIVPLHQSFNEM